MPESRGWEVPVGECILSAVTPKCACLNQYSTHCSNNTYKYAIKQWAV